MRHRISGRKLNRTMEHRRALLRNMVTSLIVEERIETTLPRAKELRRVADRMVTLGKRGSLHARRQALSYVRTNEAVKKLFSELSERFSDRNGGYTRVLKLGLRQGDAAPMAIIEYLGAPPRPSKEERKKAKEEERKQREAEAKKAKPKKKVKEAKKEKGEAKKVSEPEKKKAKAKAEEKVAKEKATKKTASRVGFAKKRDEKKAAPPTKKVTQKRGLLGRVLGRKAGRGK